MSTTIDNKETIRAIDFPAQALTALTRIREILDRGGQFDPMTPNAEKWTRVALDEARRIGEILARRDTGNA